MIQCQNIFEYLCFELPLDLAFDIWNYVEVFK